MSNETAGRPNVKQAVPFFMVVNIEASLDFYTRGLGFELKMKWEPRGKIEWCWLELGNAAIMLQEYRNSVPEIRGQGISICFMCEDALEIYREAMSRELSPMEPFVGNNAWVVQLKDPDGYNILFESTTDVPEETKYSEWVKAVKKSQN